MNFSKFNRLFGFLSGFTAFIIYFLTVEPTTSYWDTAEYISTSAKLQIGHPPGAPLFQMMGAIFSTFALENNQIALAVNMMSVTSSAFTITFLFWSTSLIGKKILNKKNIINKIDAFKIYGASFLASFTFMFTDSFWYNAVEAEVYAMATLILSILFWLGLKWESDFDNERSDKWLILISFVIGLSFGVHFMGLLAIPAIGMIYYFKKFPKFDIKKFLIANLISVSVLFFIFKLLIPSLLKLFGYLEIYFVNNLRLPFNSGTIFSAILTAYVLFSLIKFSRKKNLMFLNTITLCVTFILIGFSSWLMIPIRSNADTVINQNSPKDARSLLSYYNLEQYPETYLFYGPMFTDLYAPEDSEEPYVDGNPRYEKNKTLKRYDVINNWEIAEQNSNKKHRGIFPRMWSKDRRNMENYMKYFGYQTLQIDNKKLKSYYEELINKYYGYLENEQKEELIRDNIESIQKNLFQINNEIENNKIEFNEWKEKAELPFIEPLKPSLFDNLNYFINYQVKEMYFRYFMWNFSGRQNDIKWEYNQEDGNWISGFNFIDEARLGPQKDLPSDVLNNKARNIYYMIPLILGIIGFVMVFKKHFSTFWPIFLLFIFTGIALKFYLNERIFEPRERDYALVGSFMAFSIFIGLSFIFIFNYSARFLNFKLSSFITLLVTVSSPLLLASNNWDDHDRSGRYTAQSLAKAYLDSIDKGNQPIIFSVGDNDTFSLWYAQEIENYRTDVRVINTSLIQTDWYMDQMKRKAYLSDPIKSTLQHNQYSGDKLNQIEIIETIDTLLEINPDEPIYAKVDRVDLKEYIEILSKGETYKDYYEKKLPYKTADNKVYISSLYDQMSVPDQLNFKNISKAYLNISILPTNKVRLNVNKENVLKSGIVNPNDKDLILDYIDIDLPDRLFKWQIFMLDILASNDWERPIYFTGGSPAEDQYMWMKDYLQFDGLVYKLVPIKTEINSENPIEIGRIDPYKTYSIVKKWEWGNSNSNKIYHDPETRQNGISFRRSLLRLANELIELEENEKALEILDLSFEKMPLEYYGFYSISEPYIKSYYLLNEQKKALDLFDKIYFKYHDKLNYYVNILEQDSKFEEELLLNNIFEYNYRIEKLLTEQLKFEKYSLLKNYIADYLNISKLVGNVIGDYEYYSELIEIFRYISVNDKSEISKNLYNNIKNSITNRLDNVFSELTNISSFEEEDKSKINELIDNLVRVPLYELNQIINSLKKSRIYDDEFIKSEEKLLENYNLTLYKILYQTD